MLQCLMCGGEIEIIAGFHSTNKQIKCLKCGFVSQPIPLKKEASQEFVKKPIEVIKLR